MVSKKTVGSVGIVGFNYSVKLRLTGALPPLASRVHAAELICVKTAAILGAVLALGPFSEEDYMRLVKVSIERKDHLIGINGCEHTWPCFGFNHCTEEQLRNAYTALSC